MGLLWRSKQPAPRAGLLRARVLRAARRVRVAHRPARWPRRSGNLGLVPSGVRAVYHAGDDAALASSRSCSIAKIAVLCPDPIASLRRTASQEVVFKEAALLVEELRAGSSMLALVVSSLVASLARLCLMPVAGSRAHAVLSATCAYRVEALGELRLMC